MTSKYRNTPGKHTCTARKLSESYPQEWQKDSGKLQTAKIQYWVHGTMLTLLNQEKAKTMVDNGTAFVICEQAIGALSPEGYYAA